MGNYWMITQEHVLLVLGPFQSFTRYDNSDDWNTAWDTLIPPSGHPTPPATLQRADKLGGANGLGPDRQYIKP